MVALPVVIVWLAINSIHCLLAFRTVGPTVVSFPDSTWWYTLNKLWLNLTYLDLWVHDNQIYGRNIPIPACLFGICVF
jgi:hypothetical protein